MSAPCQPTYHDVLESLRTEAESIIETIDRLLLAGDEPEFTEWNDADEEDCEAMLECLSDAFPHNVHVRRMAELVQSTYAAVVLDAPADTLYGARTCDRTIPLDARTLPDAIAEATDADWRAGESVSIREAATGKRVAEVSG